MTDLPSTATRDPSLRLLLVDDEALARLRLRTLLAELPDVEVVGEAADADAALAWLQARAPLGAEGEAPPVDALLLDIRMPGSSAHMGLRLARAIQALPQPPAVIFVTAHAEHALAAFELEALDYLTKPVRRDRLAAALKRLRERVSLRREGVAASLPGQTPALVVSDRGRLLRVPLAEVLVLKAELKYVTLRTAERSHVLDESLTELEQRLRALGGPDAPGGPAFLRIHRNALVATHAVRELALRDGGSDGSRGSGGGRGGSDAGSDEAEDGDGAAGWAVRVAPLDEWLAVSRRQLPAVKAALAGRRGPAAGRGGAAP